MNESHMIQYSESNQYFRNSNNILTMIGCVDSLNIDIYIKKSFSVSYKDIIITGALVETFTKDHMVNEDFLIYQATPLPLHSDRGMITYTPIKKWIFSGNFITKFLQGTPLLAILGLSLLSLLLPTSVASILGYISIIGLVITYIYYGYKLFLFLFKYMTSKKVDMRGVHVTCDIHDDFIHVQDKTIDHIHTLFTSSMVQKVIECNGSWYIKQTFSQPKIGHMLLAMFKSQSPVEMNIQDKVEAIIPGLIDLAFIPPIAFSHVQ